MTRRPITTTVTVGHGDCLHLHLTRAETIIVTAALAIAANEYKARATGAGTPAATRMAAAIHLHRRISGALTKGTSR